MKVALVCMPFADVGRPSVGVSMLKAELDASRVHCDVVYPNLTFARAIGLPDYRFMTDGVPWRTLATEWVFARSLYGSEHGDAGAYVDDVLIGGRQLTAAAVHRVLSVREQAEAFVERLAVEMPWHQYDVVGFTSYSGQNLASLALARRIKRAHPHVVIVFGGRNWEGEMGLELHRKFPFVDLVCNGEADISFPSLLNALQAGDGSLSQIGGIVFRSGGQSRATGLPPVVGDLDALPEPDFSDYFEALRESGYSHQFVPVLAMEHSRGCWWAARRPCSFCGLNGSRTSYRAKSPDRFLSEARSLTASWDASYLELVDMVVPPSFFSQVLPKLAADPLPVKLLAQVRATLSRDDLELAQRSGVELQCGIESLSDPILALVNKGTTSLQNVRFLKWAEAVGLEPTWPMLHGFPQEADEDYSAVCELIPSIAFLPPPSELGSVLVPRFSAYFAEPSRHGLRRLRPLDAYRYLYPFSRSSLGRIALFFMADGCGDAAEPPYLETLTRRVREWRAGYGTSGGLRGETTAAGLMLRDARPSAAFSEMVLDPCDEAIYRACDAIASRDELVQLLDERSFSELEPTLDERLQRLVDLRIMLEADGSYLSLALVD
jgi:ribosomal peptide maturation radical SAM protein 1